MICLHWQIGRPGLGGRQRPAQTSLCCLEPPAPSRNVPPAPTQPLGVRMSNCPPGTCSSRHYVPSSMSGPQVPQLPPACCPRSDSPDGPGLWQPQLDRIWERQLRRALGDQGSPKGQRLCPGGRYLQISLSACFTSQVRAGSRARDMAQGRLHGGGVQAEAWGISRSWPGEA